MPVPLNRPETDSDLEEYRKSVVECLYFSLAAAQQIASRNFGRDQAISLSAEFTNQADDLRERFESAICHAPLRVYREMIEASFLASLPAVFCIGQIKGPSAHAATAEWCQAVWASLSDCPVPWDEELYTWCLRARSKVQELIDCMDLDLVKASLEKEGAIAARQRHQQGQSTEAEQQSEKSIPMCQRDIAYIVFQAKDLSALRTLLLSRRISLIPCFKEDGTENRQRKMIPKDALTAAERDRLENWEESQKGRYRKKRKKTDANSHELEVTRALPS